MKATGPAVELGSEATLVAAPDADPYAVEQTRSLLRGAGVRTLHESLPGGGPVVRVGGSGAGDALRALRAPDRADLPSGGYRIAVGEVAGRATVALDGLGADGLFHAVQTLRQLVTDGSVAGVTVRDWPGTAVRGMAEGFYGEPWTREERLDQISFMGRTKQNRYLYAAGDDPYRLARWREPYPADKRADFRALAERARAEHVTLGWAVSPGQAMCMASDQDVRALTKKIDAMWALGIRVFQLQFQDVSYSEWHCDLDVETFGSGPKAAARAQARVAGALARHLEERHPDAAPLSVLPTEFYQDGATDYRTALAAELDDRVQVAWTGVGVVPKKITGGELAGARAAFRHPLVTMDNYPVNDYAQTASSSARTPAGTRQWRAVRRRCWPMRWSRRPPRGSRCSPPPTSPGTRRGTARTSRGGRPSRIWRAGTRGPGRRCWRWPGTARARCSARRSPPTSSPCSTRSGAPARTPPAATRRRTGCALPSP